MSSNDSLENAIDGIRGEAAQPHAIDAASRRVRAELARFRTAADADGCAHFQGMIPSYRERMLPEGPRALLQDHLATCLACRRVFQDRDPSRNVAPMAPPIARRRRLLAAAAIVAVAGLGALLASMRNLAPDPGGRLVQVESIDGSLLSVPASGNPVAVAAGARLDGRVPLRTARGSRALVRLSDGSRVELRERSEIAVSADRRGKTIELARGGVVIHAAKQHDGHLYLSTGDCLVSVTGTIFSVDHGTKGSRVSVLEGEVQVDDGRQARSLYPGDQMTTGPGVDRVPIVEDVAWSQDRERYAQVIRELALVGAQVQVTANPSPLSPVSSLLDLVPSDTVLYAAAPNVSRSFSEAYRSLREKIAGNAVLRPWWAENVGSQEKLADAIVAEIGGFGELLGSEIVIAVGAEQGAPLFLAEAGDPALLRRRIEDGIRRVSPEGSADVAVRLVSDPRLESAAGPDELLLWVSDRVFAASTSMTALRRVADAEGSSNPFASSRFHAKLVEAYGRGVDFLLAADIRGMGEHLVEDGWNRQALERAGALDADVLLVEQRRTDAGVSQSRATLSFDGPRRGVASWLAAPAPMGSLDYVSPQARLVCALALKDPALAMDDLLHVLDAAGTEAREAIASLEDTAHLRIHDDLAAPLGGEIAIAIDGPVLPFPAWKAIVEVYDPARLQKAIEWIVQDCDARLRQNGEQGVVLEPAVPGSRTFYAIHARGETGGIYYVMQDGYAVVASSREVLDQALRIREAGHGIARSAKFRALCPADGNTNFSAVVYQDMTPDLAPLLRRLAPSIGGGFGASPEALAHVIGHASLAYAYAEEDRITFAADDVAESFGLDLRSLLTEPPAATNASTP